MSQVNKILQSKNLQQLKGMKKKEKFRARQKLNKSRPKDLKVDNSKSAEDSDTKLT